MRRRILLAEDDAELRRTLSALLSSYGFAIEAATDGGDALRRFEINRSAGALAHYDALVLDVRMPQRSGLDLLVTLRKEGNRTPVVLMTAFGDPALHESVRAMGAAVVLDKPFDIEDLREALHRLLR